MTDSPSGISSRSLPGECLRPWPTTSPAISPQIRARRRWDMHAGFSHRPRHQHRGVFGRDGSSTSTWAVLACPSPATPRNSPPPASGFPSGPAANTSFLCRDNLRMRAGANTFSIREYEGGRFDQTSLSAHLGPRWLPARTTEGSFLASAQRRWSWRRDRSRRPRLPHRGGPPLHAPGDCPRPRFLARPEIPDTILSRWPCRRCFAWGSRGHNTHGTSGRGGGLGTRATGYWAAGVTRGASSGLALPWRSHGALPWARPPNTGRRTMKAIGFPHTEGRAARGQDSKLPRLGPQPGARLPGLQPAGIAGARDTRDQRPALRLREDGRGIEVCPAVLTRIWSRPTVRAFTWRK